MKQIYTFITLSVVLMTTTLAQPILTQSNFTYNYPDSAVYFIADSLSVLDTTVGANVIFDYTKLRGYGSKQTGYYVNPASTPSASDFPTANMAENTDATPQNFVYTLSSVDSVANIGFVADITGFGLTTGKYDIDPEAIMRFPFAFNDSYTDHYAGSFSAVVSGSPQSTNATGSVIISADAWGKLIYSSTISLDSVLRVKRVENTVTDSILGGIISPITVEATIINYYQPSVSKAPILSFVEGSYSQNGSVIQSNKTIVSQYPMAFVSVEEIKLLNNMELFPNPTINNSTTLTLNIEKPTKIKVELLNTLGQSVLKVAEKELVSGKNKIEINTATLSSGIYFVAIEIDGKTKGAKKIIIE
jgi:hypothetical protein